MSDSRDGVIQSERCMAKRSDPDRAWIGRRYVAVAVGLPQLRAVMREAAEHAVRILHVVIDASADLVAVDSAACVVAVVLAVA